MNRPSNFTAEAENRIKPLTLLWCTDLHNDIAAFNEILRIYHKFNTYIKDIIHTGDIVEKNGETMYNMSAWFDPFYGSEKILNCVGNHDEFDASYGRTRTAIDTYNNIIKNYVQYWDVVQPTSAETNGLNYYYKDYTDQNQNIRLIVLDCIYWDAAEETWLESVLADSLTNNKSVICATHYLPAKVNPFETPFSTRLPSWPINSTFLNSTAVQAVQDFIDNDGTFICWLSGHIHKDCIGTLVDYPQQLSITCTAALGASTTYHDTNRSILTENYHAFNLIAFDTNKKYIKIARIGAQYDEFLRKKDTLTVNYENQTIVI